MKNPSLDWKDDERIRRLENPVLQALHVYRNVFESKKYVEVYAAERIAAELGLDRARMAELALLLGSDYTEVGDGEQYQNPAQPRKKYH